MMKPRILLFLIVLCFQGFAQEKPKTDTTKTSKMTQSSVDDRAKKLLPQYAPLSPNATSFQKFGDYQVNLATGIPNISIPLLTVQEGGLAIPISLNYHAGGFKMNEQASWVGWGWALDMGASLNRTVQGLKDDKDGGSYLTNPITAARDFCYKKSDFDYGQSVVLNQIDTQPDIFSYSIPSKSGKFILGQNGNSPFKIPEYPIQINHSGSPNISTFHLINDDGVAYTFGEGESQNVISGNSTQNYISSWLITQIRSANSDDFINFSYQNGGSQFLSEKQWFASIIYNAVGYYYSNSTSFIPNYTVVSTTISQKNPYKITYSNGEIEFIQSVAGERKDLTSSQFLKQINVYNYENNVKTLIKVIKFNYSYFNAASRLKLDKIIITDQLSTTTEEYSFDYWTNTFSWNDATDNEKKDFFGYYNGKPNTHLIPVSSYNGIPILGGAANRSTVDTYMKSAVLKRINFPTKGYTEFDYETNKFSDGTNVLFAGGLRVKSIKNVSAGNTTLKRYEYASSAGTGVGRLTTNWTPTSAGQPQIQHLLYDDQEGNQNSFGSADQASFTQSGGAVDFNTMDSAPVYYTNVTEYFEESSDPVKNGKNIYTFDFENDIIVNAPTYKTRMVKPWKRGNLLSKTTYNNSNIIATLSNQYTELQSNTRLAGAFVNVPNVYQGFGGSTCATGFNANLPEMVYGAVTYHTGINLLSTTTNQVDNVATTQTNTYNGELYTVQTSTNNSQTNNILTEKYVYPSDPSYATNTIAKEMLVRNQRNTMLETEVKEIISGVATILHKDKKVYGLYPGANARGLSNNLLPSEIWIAPKGGNLEKRAYFVSYDSKGNPSNYVVDDLPISLLWGYNDALLLAEAKNVSLSNFNNTLNAAGIKAVAMSSTTLSVSQLSQIKTLRDNLPNAQISWFSHRPQIGVSNIVSPNGLMSSFSYDKLNRLRSIKDHNGYLTDVYSYIYTSSSPNPCAISPPSIALGPTSLCDATLNASGCNGTVSWSNGASGTSITVASKTSGSYSATCTSAGCTSAQSNIITLPSLPSGWNSDDIGTANGCTQYVNNALILKGSGSIGATGSTNDSFHWVYKKLSGDVTVITKIASIPAVDGNRVGLMLRNSLNNNSTDFSLFQDGNTYVGLFRRENDGNSNVFSGFQQAALNATWLKIVKKGNLVSFYFSTNTNPESNNAWSNAFSLVNGANFPQTINFSTDFYLGFAIWGNTNQASFSNISINGQSF